MTNARSLVPKLLLFAVSTLLVAGEAHATSLYYLYDSAGNRIATIDPQTLNAAIPASQLKPGAVTSKLFPDYSSGVPVSAWNEYPTADPSIAGPGWLVVIFQGIYMNAARILVGPNNTTPSIEVFRTGHDANYDNTNAVTAVIPIPANTRFVIQNGTSSGTPSVSVNMIGRNPGHGFENVEARFYRVDRP